MLLALAEEGGRYPGTRGGSAALPGRRSLQHPTSRTRTAHARRRASGGRIQMRPSPLLLAGAAVGCDVIAPRPLSSLRFPALGRAVSAAESFHLCGSRWRFFPLSPRRGWVGGRGLPEPTPPGADLPLPSLSPREERREAFSDGFGGLGGGDAAGGRAGG